MRTALTIFLAFFAAPVFAHPGHWADVAGHDHWIAGAAIGLAGLAAIWGALKGKKAKAEETQDDDDATEEEAA